MTSPDPAVQMFFWRPDWLFFLAEAGLGAALLASGFAVGATGDWIGDWGFWSAVLGVLIWIVVVILMLCGVGIYCVLATCLLIHVLRIVAIVSVHRENVWIMESPQVDLFPKTVIVPFASIVQVKREWVAGNRGCLQIVHGPDRKTETVYEIHEEDIAHLYTILAERCPTAVTSAPRQSP